MCRRMQIRSGRLRGAHQKQKNGWMGVMRKECEAGEGARQNHWAALPCQVISM